jgi:hypothetical protein
MAEYRSLAALSLTGDEFGRGRQELVGPNAISEDCAGAGIVLGQRRFHECSMKECVGCAATQDERPSKGGRSRRLLRGGGRSGEMEWLCSMMVLETYNELLEMPRAGTLADAALWGVPGM